MSPSADRHAGTLTAGAALALGAVLAAGAASAGAARHPARAEPSPSPYVLTTPSAKGVDRAPVTELDPPVQNLTAPVRDIARITSSLDGSFRDREAGDQRTLTLAADVLFEFDEASLTDEARGRVRKASRLVRENAAEGAVHIDGYTDSKGAEDYNLELSRERAAAVEDALDERLNGSAVTFETEGHGEADPVAPNETEDGEDNPEGRAKNRRVEITFRQ